jgi:maltooligosyltrehalose trehalohydrolase
MKGPRGTDPSSVPLRQCIVCLQNHDQIGNRAFGDRLHHGVDAARWRAASALLLTCPMTPLLFMGQEWAASSPFQFFTDFEPALGTAVTEGRRREFKAFPAFASDPTAAAQVPDPQALSTFDASKLRWAERSQPPHSGMLALYTALLALRSAHPALAGSDRCAVDAWPVDEGSVVMRRTEGSATFLIVVRLTGSGAVPLEALPPDAGVDALRDVAQPFRAGRENPRVVLTTEEGRFAEDPHPPQICGTRVVFDRPGAVILGFS